ncbi:MAG: hypothetical protein IPP57_18085 [Candidatus Obscuribacter sp.]|nr:hypothetical protein [Candidatus Obscuribacter sp.]
MSATPELVSICLCERLLQDVFRRDSVTLVNVHNSVASQGFPILIPVIYAFAQLSPSPKPFTYKFVITDSKNAVVTASLSSEVAALHHKNALHKVIGAFTSLVLPAADVYTVTLFIDDKAIGTIPFEAAMVQAEELSHNKLPTLIRYRIRHQQEGDQLTDLPSCLLNVGRLRPLPLLWQRYWGRRYRQHP